MRLACKCQFRRRQKELWLRMESWKVPMTTSFSSTDPTWTVWTTEFPNSDTWIVRAQCFHRCYLPATSSTYCFHLSGKAVTCIPCFLHCEHRKSSTAATMNTTKRKCLPSTSRFIWVNIVDNHVRTERIWKCSIIIANPRSLNSTPQSLLKLEKIYGHLSCISVIINRNSRSVLLRFHGSLPPVHNEPFLFAHYLGRSVKFSYFLAAWLSIPFQHNENAVKETTLACGLLLRQEYSEVIFQVHGQLFFLSSWTHLEHQLLL